MVIPILLLQRSHFSLILTHMILMSLCVNWISVLSPPNFVWGELCEYSVKCMIHKWLLSDGHVSLSQPRWLLSCTEKVYILYFQLSLYERMPNEMIFDSRASIQSNESPQYQLDTSWGAPHKMISEWRLPPPHTKVSTHGGKVCAHLSKLPFTPCMKQILTERWSNS